MASFSVRLTDCVHNNPKVKSGLYTQFCTQNNKKIGHTAGRVGPQVK